ncbi:class I SAM-dependent methyltransferase [Kineosporia sp. J2-2]|uniref:Class I SAM-dependent methyltransferase n=1 Tax=Kineosporia corallincola TaxID=2835133 RepID=A0ABS5TGZ0_9ACTN|nr:methyltransferase domain-containing protein [Kineosporia corallincola]MBT0770138.1 class I SAM-dependent methyltransferase [Kineosporia corallincola]
MPENYGMRRTPEEYERLRAQARIWEDATGRLLGRLGLAEGASCLDAGCGPGEAMRLMAERVGPSGSVTGLDSDAALGASAQDMLHGLGHTQCRVRSYEIGAEPIPDGPYDLVFARLLLFHLPHRAQVLARLWDAVAPGGYLLVQDYDLGVVGSVPPSPASDDVNALLADAFGAIGCDIRTGAKLGSLFAEAGIGAPDGSDIAGTLSALGPGRAMLEGVVRGVLPAAVARGAVDPARAEAVLARVAQEADAHPDRPLLPPLLIGTWKRKK